MPKLQIENACTHRIAEAHCTHTHVHIPRRSRTFDEFPFINHLSDVKKQHKTAHNRGEKKPNLKYILGVKEEREKGRERASKMTISNNAYLSRSHFGDVVECTENLRTNVFYDLNRDRNVGCMASPWNSIKKTTLRNEFLYSEKRQRWRPEIQQNTAEKKCARENRRMLRLFSVLPFLSLFKITGLFVVFFDAMPFSLVCFAQANRSEHILYDFDTERTLCFVCHQAYIMSETCKIARWLWSGPCYVYVKHGFF